MTVLPARLAAALFFRSDFGGGLPRPSDDGGLLEFRDVFASRSSSSAIRSRARASFIQRHSQIPAQRHHQRGEHLTAATIMIAGHTRTLRDVDPLPPAIRIGRRVGATAERHTALHIPDQLHEIFGSQTGSNVPDGRLQQPTAEQGYLSIR